MTDEEIYKLWKSRTPDPRYLRPKRWEQIKEVIVKYEVTSVLEFGSGISTLLFNNLGLKVYSLETDFKHIKFVKSFHPLDNVTFMVWDNKLAPVKNPCDLALVDGDLPRTCQFETAVRYTKIIAVDDFEMDLKSSLLPRLANFERIDCQLTSLAIFRRKD